jgi:3-methyladenine DNA glycosylase AlkD
MVKKKPAAGGREAMLKKGFCGDVCELCPRYTATQSGDPNRLNAVAGLYRRLGWRDESVTPVELLCFGCTETPSCVLGVRECARERKVDHCGVCGDYPCSRIDRAFELSARYEALCLERSSSEEYAVLKKAFFEKKENLIGRDSGRTVPSAGKKGQKHEAGMLNRLPGMNAQDIHAKLHALGNPQQAQVLRRYFKTGPGEYGEGDVFVGMRVPELRKLAKEYRSLSISETVRLLQSPVHEARLLALLIFIRNYAGGDVAVREMIFDEYLRNTRFINNWDLVDVSAEHIVGAHLKNGGRDRLQVLAESCMLWERRIAVMATFHYIKQGDFDETLRIAEFLLRDPEDLIHKAVGWMLREIGKRDRQAEETFLRAHCKIMPRTMLRYALEKFPEGLRRQYLRGEM